MRILCVSDSLGLPRSNVRYESTWYYKLSHFFNNIDFIPKLQRNLTSQDILIPDFSDFYNPNIVILQIGICDCAPRLYKRKKLFWIVLERVFHRYLYYIVKKTKKRLPKNSDVSINDFEINISLYYSRLKKLSSFKKLIIILIGSSKKRELTIKSPYWHDNIEKYNAVLRSFKKYKDVIIIDPLANLDESFFVEDGYHTNDLGNNVIFNELKKIINNYV